MPCAQKSDGKSLWPIAGARRANQVFGDPPGVGLLAAEGPSRGEVIPPPGMAAHSQGAVDFPKSLQLVVGTSDVANCFRCLRPAMAAYSILPAAPAHVLRPVGESRGRPLPEPGVAGAPSLDGAANRVHFWLARRISER